MGLQRAKQHDISGSSESPKSNPIWRTIWIQLGMRLAPHFSASAILCLVFFRPGLIVLPPQNGAPRLAWIDQQLLRQSFQLSSAEEMSTPIHFAIEVHRSTRRRRNGFDPSWPVGGCTHILPCSQDNTKISPFTSYFICIHIWAFSGRPRVAFASLM